MKPIPSALAAPWAIEPHWLRVVFGVWSRGKIDAGALAQANAEWESRKASRPRLDEPGAPVEGTGGTLRIVGDVGVLSIEGSLFRHASMFSDISGGTSYDAVWRGLEAALTSRQVNTILLRVNSPGGEADGVNELAKGIRAAAEQKPVYAYVDGMCASAAYWLASQADHIVAEETSEIGSIGVRCGIVDYSAQDEAMGVREIEIISSQSPGKRSKPVDDAVVGRLQTRIDDLADLFIAAVADGRGVTAETVMDDFGQGDVMIASKALDAGLIDEVGNFNGTLTAIAAASQGGRSARAKDRTMAKEAIKPTADAKDGDGEWQCAGCKEMMGKSADAYCAKCSDDDEPDGDEDEAKALGLDPKASLGARRARASALVALEQKLAAAAGVQAHEHDKIVAAVTESLGASAEIAKVKAEGQKTALRSMLERGIAGAPGKQPTLSLGQIQKNMATALRGPTRKAWVAAMDKLVAEADAAATEAQGATDPKIAAALLAKSKVTSAQIIEAACSVQLSAEDMESLQDYAATSSPVAASTFAEPARDGIKEAAEIDAKVASVAKAADAARAALDKNKPAAK